MKVSIIMPTYNRANTIKRAIDSILNQTYANYELIIVDDGSIDNSKNIIKNYSDKRIKYIYQKNQGACSARNNGIINSSGDYIAFLDSDDEWDIFKLEKQVEYIKRKKVQIAFCNYYYEKNNRKTVGIENLKKDYIEKQELLDKNYITTGALIIERNILIKNKMFDEKMPRYQDWELALRLADNYNIYFQNECLLTLHFQNNSISNSTSLSKKINALERIYKKNKDYYDNNKKAYAHLFWSIGMYKLCAKEKCNKELKTGVFYNKLNYKRLCIFILIKMGAKRIIIKEYLKNH